MKQTDFFLKKLKLDAKTVVVNYTKAGSDEEIQSTKKNIPHPDMRAKLALLKPLLADIMCTDAEKFNINGIVLSAIKDNPQVMILGQFVTVSGHKIVINSHNILYDGGDYEGNDKLESIVGDITTEVFEYLFGRKQAQLDLVDESEKLEMVEQEPEVKKSKKK